MKTKNILIRIVVSTSIFLPIIVSAAQNTSGSTNPDICLSTMLDRYLWTRGVEKSDKDKTLKEKYNLAEEQYKQQKLKGFNVFNGPWDRGLVPILDAQKEAVLEALTGADISLYSLNAAEDYLRSNKPAKLSGIVKQFTQQFGGKTMSIDELGQESQEKGYQEQVAQKASVIAACAQLSVFDSISCTSAVDDLRKELRFNSNMILPDVWKNFTSDKTLIEGTRQAALIMIGRMKSKLPGRVFTDIRQGFLNAGLDDKKSEQATWQVLALYGNGGHNTGFRMAAFDTPASASFAVVGLSVIGTAITYLDFAQRMNGGGHYAYPKEMTGSCITPKPYHFWLNAYLGHWLVKKGYSKEASQAAVFIAAKGYQVNRDLNNAGSGVDKILSKPTDHPTNHVIRVDLSMSAAGVVYGSNFGSTEIKPFDINDGYNILDNAKGNGREISQGFIQGLLKSDRLKLLYIWDKMFQPNLALEYFRKIQTK